MNLILNLHFIVVYVKDMALTFHMLNLLANSSIFIKSVVI